MKNSHKNLFFKKFNFSQKFIFLYESKRVLRICMHRYKVSLFSPFNNYDLVRQVLYLSPSYYNFWSPVSTLLNVMLPQPTELPWSLSLNALNSSYKPTSFCLPFPVTSLYFPSFHITFQSKNPKFLEESKVSKQIIFKNNLHSFHSQKTTPCLPLKWLLLAVFHTKGLNLKLTFMMKRARKDQWFLGQENGAASEGFILGEGLGLKFQAWEDCGGKEQGLFLPWEARIVRWREDSKMAKINLLTFLLWTTCLCNSIPSHWNILRRVLT